MDIGQENYKVIVTDIETGLAKIQISTRELSELLALTTQEVVDILKEAKQRHDQNNSELYILNN